MKKITRKLQFNREVLRAIGGDQLTKVVGGDTIPPEIYTHPTLVVARTFAE